MSYDLFFRSPSPSVRFSSADFEAYFRPRRWYEVKNSQAWYRNRDSGVYFGFEYNDPHADSAAEDVTEPGLIPVSFNMNYFRPHPFGLEAEPEVAAFVQEHDLTVVDPQTAMADGQYSREGFLGGWNAGNAFGYRSLLPLDTGIRPFPSSRIEVAWRWNFNRAVRQNEIGDRAFVPLILFLDVGGVVRTGVVWGDGLPILLPVVDLVLVPRKLLAPRRRLRSKEDVVVFARKELEPILRRFRRHAGKPAAYELFYETTPADIERLIREKQPRKEVPNIVEFEYILDQELVDQARGSGGSN